MGIRTGSSSDVIITAQSDMNMSCDSEGYIKSSFKHVSLYSSQKADLTLVSDKIFLPQGVICITMPIESQSSLSLSAPLLL
jgi:hypothetical protein